MDTDLRRRSLFAAILRLSGSTEIYQEYVQVLCLTDPSIPDRTTSLQSQSGRQQLVDALVRAARRLEVAGATEILMACHTPMRASRRFRRASPLRS